MTLIGEEQHVLSWLHNYLRGQEDVQFFLFLPISIFLGGDKKMGLRIRLIGS